jgi:hypothetical protein
LALVRAGDRAAAGLAGVAAAGWAANEDGRGKAAAPSSDPDPDPDPDPADSEAAPSSV